MDRTGTQPTTVQASVQRLPALGPTELAKPRHRRPRAGMTDLLTGKPAKPAERRSLSELPALAGGHTLDGGWRHSMTTSGGLRPVQTPFHAWRGCGGREGNLFLWIGTLFTVDKNQQLGDSMTKMLGMRWKKDRMEPSTCNPNTTTRGPSCLPKPLPAPNTEAEKIDHLFSPIPCS